MHKVNQDDKTIPIKKIWIEKKEKYENRRKKPQDDPHQIKKETTMIKIK